MSEETYTEEGYVRTVLELIRVLEELNPATLLLNGDTGETGLYFGEVDEYIDTDSGEEVLHLPLMGCSFSGEEPEDWRFHADMPNPPTPKPEQTVVSMGKGKSKTRRVKV